MFPHPELMRELIRQHELELVEEAARYRRMPRGRDRRHALHTVLHGRSSGPEDH